MHEMKGYRKNELKHYVIGNTLLALLLCGFAETLPKGNYSNNIFNLAHTIFAPTLILSVAYIYVFLIDSLIPVSWKINITCWPFKLPGYTIFSTIEQKCQDYRFTQGNVKTKYQQIYNNMPTNKNEKYLYENAEWYKIYLKHEDKDKIRTANHDFLLCRDIVTITLVLMILYPICYCCLAEISYKALFITELIFFVEFIASRMAAYNKAQKLVLDVIAEDVHEGS